MQCLLVWPRCRVSQSSITPLHYKKKQLIQLTTPFISGSSTLIPMPSPHSGFDEVMVMQTHPCPCQKKKQKNKGKKKRLFALKGLHFCFRTWIICEKNKNPPSPSSVLISFTVLSSIIYTSAHQQQGDSSIILPLMLPLIIFLRSGQQQLRCHSGTTRRGCTVNVKSLLQCGGLTTTKCGNKYNRFVEMRMRAYV